MAARKPPARRRRCTTCHKLRLAKQYSTPGARVCNPCKRAGTRKAARARHLWETYGLTQDEYDAILVEQGQCCGGCKGTRRYALHVDHDHKVQAHLLSRGMDPLDAAKWSVRGLLCARCNKVLRDVRDDAPTLVRLADYLANPPAHRVLVRAA